MTTPIDHHPLLPRIEAFLRETGIAEATFGQRAAGDWRLVERLRGGGDMRRKTERRVKEFMASPEARRIIPRRDNGSRAVA